MTTNYDYFYNAIKDLPCEVQLKRLLDIRIEDGILPGTSYDDHIEYDFETNIPRELIEYIETFNCYFYDAEHSTDPAYQYIADTIYNYYNESMETLINTPITDPATCMATFQTINNTYNDRFNHIVETIIKNKKPLYDNLVIKEFGAEYNINQDDLDFVYTNALLNPNLKFYNLDNLTTIYLEFFKTKDIDSKYRDKRILNTITWRVFASEYKFINEETTKIHAIMDKFAHNIEELNGEDDKLGFTKMFANIETVSNAVSKEIKTMVDKALEGKTFNNNIETRKNFIEFKIKQCTPIVLAELKANTTPEIFQLVSSNIEMHNAISRLDYTFDTLEDVLKNLMLCGAE